MEKVLIADTLTPAGEPRDTMVWALERETYAARRDRQASQAASSRT
jgi:hypothetical protein